MTMTQPRFDGLDLHEVSTAALIAMHAELVARRDAATSHPIVHQALSLRVYQVESAIAVRNAQVMADLDDAAEQRTVAEIRAWVQSLGGRTIERLWLEEQLTRRAWRSR